MNANELAEFWELVAQNCQEKGWFATDNGKNGMLITATMLRQQQAEIEALKRALALKNNWEQISNEIQVKIVNDTLRKVREK